jgi:hypothetical protein
LQIADCRTGDVGAAPSAVCDPRARQDVTQDLSRPGAEASPPGRSGTGLWVPMPSALVGNDQQSRSVPRTTAAAQRRLAELRARWDQELPEAMACLQGGFAAATVFYGFPLAHWKKIRTTNGLERLHGEIKRRIRAVGAFPDRASALRLITAVALKVAAIWGDRRYVDVALLQQEVDQAA